MWRGRKKGQGGGAKVEGGNREMGVGKVGVGERKRGKEERIGAVWI
jgi:hypothetical protein